MAPGVRSLSLTGGVCYVLLDLNTKELEHKTDCEIGWQ
jgi:hypothetical protein